MRLLRVQVPEFRALKDVDISFEPEFVPQVFPLGSLNGGGKSTLLQLIFVLLNLELDFSDGYDEYNSKLYESCFKDWLLNLAPSKDIEKIATIVLLNEESIEMQFDYFYGSGSLKNTGFFNSDELYFRGIIPYKNPNCLALVVRIIKNNKNVTKADSFPIINKTLSNIKSRLFLISPSNQPYIFLSREENRLLFKINPEKNYDQVLKGLKEILPNFYTYDFIDVLTEVCRLERDKDFDEKLATGVYGTHYEKLETDINNLFIDGKKIIPLTVQQKRHTKDAIQSMGFKLPNGTEIYPEDLSHGELKRLAIFVLIKYHEIQDSIVLMDEIENGFHLDWQYNIVRDLIKWGSTNQYILATHSYELCTALTPAHVKEIEPKLIAN
jgi:Fe-S cluster assembly ATPase SufC